MNDQITSPKQRAFLEAYSECGSVRRAAELAGIHRSSHYGWLQNDPDYAAAYKLCYRMASDALVDECIQRAQLGIEEYVVSGGQVVMFFESNEDGLEIGRPLKKRKYSDSLLAMLVKGRAPEYSDKVKTEHSGAVKIEHAAADVDLSSLSDEEFADLKRLVERARALGGVGGNETQVLEAPPDVSSDGPAST